MKFFAVTRRRAKLLVDFNEQQLRVRIPRNVVVDRYVLSALARRIVTRRRTIAAPTAAFTPRSILKSGVPFGARGRIRKCVSFAVNLNSPPNTAQSPNITQSPQRVAQSQPIAPQDSQPSTLRPLPDLRRIAQSRRSLFLPAVQHSSQPTSPQSPDVRSISLPNSRTPLTYGNGNASATPRRISTATQLILARLDNAVALAVDAPAGDNNIEVIEDDQEDEVTLDLDFTDNTFGSLQYPSSE